ncbi:MAG: TonB-dependent receptor [Xanthomonadales bacterium]
MTHTRKNRITAFSLIVTALFALLFSLPLAAQQTGEIAGKVTNADDGAPIAGVSIEATGERLPGVRTTTTSANGDYRLPLLPPGNYRLTYTLPDGTTRVRGTDVLLQQRTTVNLPVDFNVDESMLEEVLVTASNVLMETSGSSLSGAIDSETFDALPVGQEYRDLIKLIPGVQFTADSVRGPSAGGNGQDNTYQFDGVDVSLPLFGTLSTQPSTHDIDQVSIVRGGATAVGFNRSGGFKVNTISKSGSNEFSGMISYQLQDSSWESDRDYESATNFDQTLDWTVANFSGPLIKDRLFFYVSYYAPTTERDNRDNAYGPVPNYKSERDEYFGKLTWAVTDDILLEGSYRSSETDASGEGVGGFESADGSSGSDATLDIAILEGNWIIDSNSSAYFKYTDFQNETTGAPDLVLDAMPSIGASLDLANLDRLGQFQVPSLSGDPEFDAWAQPLIDRYGYTENGVAQGGGVVGAATQFNVQNFYRESFEIGYDLTLEFGSLVHNLHFGYHQEEIEEYLDRYSNGWGFIDSPGGVEEFEGQPVYFLATFLQNSLSQFDVAPIRSYVETRNIEINDSIEWGDWTFNLGVLWSEDKLFGQGLKVNKDNVSGYELAPGHKYPMHEESFSDMMQPRLGVTWDFADNMSAFANYARYYPSASSLARAASWDRNTGNLIVDVYFDENGNQIGIEPRGSSSGKLFQKGIDPRHIDEYIIGMNWEVTDRLSTRVHYRRREARDMWEDTYNWALEAYSCTNEPDRFGCMPAGWAPEEPYIPELEDYRAEIGGSSFVIAQIPRAYTDYDEVSFEAEWAGDNWYLQGSYTWSRYRGNFDQDNSTTTNDANVFIGSSFISDGRGRMLWNFKDGKLKGDRPHLLKLFGYYELPWNAQMGFYALYQSGQPWESWDGRPYGYSSSTYRFIEPAGSRRSESHYQLDLNYTQNFYFGANNRYAFQVRADLYNVFDNQTGYNINPFVTSAGYGEPRSYYNPRRLQLLAKFMF